MRSGPPRGKVSFDDQRRSSTEFYGAFWGAPMTGAHPCISCVLDGGGHTTVSLVYDIAELFSLSFNNPRCKKVVGM
jgi:hypothetical protein